MLDGIEGIRKCADESTCGQTPKTRKKPRNPSAKGWETEQKGSRLQRGGAEASEGVKACADNIIPKLFYSSAGRGDGRKSLAIKEK